MLKQFPILIEIMLEQAMELSFRFRQGMSSKPITAKNVLSLIQFSQNLMTGAYIIKDPFSQIPGFGEQECKRVTDVMRRKFPPAGGQLQKPPTLDKYARLTKEERIAMAPDIFGLPQGDPKLQELIKQ